ncbi:hypothetical protein QBC35DRAFT_17150 [Podospora australis]|uniref:Monooxygenase n=1 Tax=Podospora australis TaxID=1536484 RepID=A0AAN6WQ24_9PEZI|nr:hypothetical protein QBC35DRAFT_17150 [Podospora australis]
MAAEELDILIIGAGLSGINAAYRLQTELPHRTFALLESRHEIGGTWAFWKYPGIRTDSAMALFGFPWRPWPYEQNMADAPQIKAYMEECAAAEGIDKKIRFHHRVKSASWSSEEQKWTVECDVTGSDGSVETKVIKAWWLINCAGYYSYSKVQPVVIPGIENFRGEVVHPQSWNDSVEYADKKVIIIGSGATAITLLPALAKTAKNVTMLQRSPSYVMSLPRKDRSVKSLSRWMPENWAITINWWTRMIVETLFVQFVLNFPKQGRRFLRAAMLQHLPKGYDVDKHFNPRYDPFQQRLCFCPGADFFKVLHQPNAQIVTDIIDTVTEDGILLKSGEKLEADMIITATGLYMSVFDLTAITVDGQSVNDTLGERYAWNATMLEGVPNAGMVTGYVAATWTPGADVRTRQLIKVIKQQEKIGAVSATPYIEDSERAKFAANPFMTLSATYTITARKRLPLTANVGPWRAGSNWAQDWWRLVTGSVNAGMKYAFNTKSKDI